MTARPRIDWLLFDVGGVLVDYQPRAWTALAERASVPVERLRGALDGISDGLGRGHVTPDQLSSRLHEDFDLALTRAELATLFSIDLRDLMPGAEALVAELAPRHRLAILSNTFFAHWDHLLTTPLFAHFEQALASHELGAMKPEREIYERALARLDSPAERVVFIDDKAENAEAASALGMHGVHATSVPEIRAALLALELL